jgi:hypothetical protein
MRPSDRRSVLRVGAVAGSGWHLRLARVPPPCPWPPQPASGRPGIGRPGGRPTGGLTDLGGPHVDRPESLGVLLDLELDPLALGERRQATGRQGADVDEHILALLRGDEAIARSVLNHFTVPTTITTLLGPAGLAAAWSPTRSWAPGHAAVLQLPTPRRPGRRSSQGWAGGGQSVSGQAENPTGDGPGLGWRRGPARTRPPAPVGRPGPPTDWPERPTVPARGRQVPPGRALGAGG